VAHVLLSHWLARLVQRFLSGTCASLSYVRNKRDGLRVHSAFVCDLGYAAHSILESGAVVAGWPSQGAVEDVLFKIL
jgi:hypothetical protein